MRACSYITGFGRDPYDSQETQERHRRETPEPILPTPESSPGIKREKGDLLGKFYEEALYGHGDEAEDELDDDGAHGHNTAEQFSSVAQYQRRSSGYLCNQVEFSKGSGLNDDIISKVRR